jgi:hypothetical protein
LKCEDRHTKKRGFYLVHAACGGAPGLSARRQQAVLSTFLSGTACQLTSVDRSLASNVK